MKPMAIEFQATYPTYPKVNVNVSAETRIKLVGLATLGKDYNQLCTRIRDSIVRAVIPDEPEESDLYERVQSYADDLVWGRDSVTEFLKYIGAESLSVNEVLNQLTRQLNATQPESAETASEPASLRPKRSYILGEDDLTDSLVGKSVVSGDGTVVGIALEAASPSEKVEIDLSEALAITFGRLRASFGLPPNEIFTDQRPTPSEPGPVDKG